MAAIDSGDLVPSNGFRLPLASRLAGLWQAMRERRGERRMLVKLSRYQPRLLRDIGLDPDTVHDAGRTAWDVEIR